MGVWMKSAVSAAILGVMAIGLAGCGSTMSNWLEKDTPTQTAAVNRDLTMPPDMQLPPPGSAPAAPAAYASNEPDLYSGSDTPVVDTPPVQPVAPAAPRPTAADNVYTQAGISLTKPDGTRKSDVELRQELQQIYLAKKKQKNQNYGTVFNIGNIFKDE
jgi:hypothetical protein